MQISNMIPGVSIMDGKVSLANVDGAGGSGDVLRPQKKTLKKTLGFKDHPDWLKTDLNLTEIITV